MKTQLLIPIVILTSNFMLPLLVLGQEQAATSAAPNPFKAIPAIPSLVQQIEAISLKFDGAFNKTMEMLSWRSLPQPRLRLRRWARLSVGRLSMFLA
jgi:hypothetical protein